MHSTISCLPRTKTDIFCHLEDGKVKNIQGGTVQIFNFLKGLSHELDFKNIDKFTELGLTKGRCWLLNFLGAPMIYSAKFYLLRLMPDCDGLIMVSCLFLSVLLILSGV
jgi:hypothetical protein